MSVLVVGVSHNTAPVAVLERLALDADGVDKLVHEVADCEHVARGDRAGHLQPDRDLRRGRPLPRQRRGGLPAARASCADEAPEDVVPHLYVHYDDGAVSHLFHVASGLDSMVVGESQILGQAREALRVGQEAGTVGPALNVLFQQALRVGKRAHAETDIDRAAPSLVCLALDRAADRRSAPSRASASLVVGAGSMAGLAVATADPARRRRRSSSPAAPRPTRRRLAEQYDGRAVPLTEVAGGARPTSTCWSPAPAPPASCCRCRSWPPRAPTPTARWPSSTSPCRTTSTRPSPSCPASR